MTGTERYERQTALPGIGQEGQERLAHSKVLVAGAGGLGSPLCLYLAAAGIGTIGIADFDTVSISNLQRQILYNEADLGKAKADLAASRIKAINSATEVHVHGKITAGNAEAIISGYDIVADGCDNFETRYILNDACLSQRKPFVYGAVCGFEGQVSVFCTGNKPCSYRDLYPDEKAMLSLEADKRVIGPVAGITACVQASEVIKLVCGCGTQLIGKLWTINALTMETNLVELDYAR